jgi:hypothetical protein
MSGDTRRRVWLVASVLTAGAGLVLVVTAAAGMARDHPVPRDFGVTAQPAANPPPPTASGPHTGQTPAARPRAAPTATRDGTLPPSPEAPAEPAALTIPALQVRATVLPVVTSHGTLGVPDDPAQVGWWTGSALPGASTGSVVIDGHVDSATAGPGALFRLADLHTGDLILVTTTTGDRRSYTVTGRRVYLKAGGLPPALFAATGPPRLVLISCGGPFNRATGNYLDNIAVFAVPT